MTCQLDVFAFTFDNQRTRPHVSCKDGLQRREQVARKKTIGGEAFLFQIERELTVVIFVPREVGIDRYLLDAPVEQERVFERIGPRGQLVVIISVEFHAIVARKFPHAVIEALILQPVDAPTASAQLQRFGDDITFEQVRKTTSFSCFGKKYPDGCTARIGNMGLKLSYFGETA